MKNATKNTHTQKPPSPDKPKKKKTPVNTGYWPEKHNWDDGEVTPDVEGDW